MALDLIRSPHCAAVLRLGGVVMRLVRRLSLVPVLGIVALAVFVEPAGSTYPGANGRIAFAQGSQILSVRPDGTGLELLATVTSPAGVRSFASFPSFSADGSKIAVMLHEFDRPTPCDPRALNVGSGACQSLVLMNADGSGQRVVYASEDVTGSSALSPTEVKSRSQW